jgi:hypothetical protein
VQAEYGSAARTQEFVLWLIKIGASPDLIRMGLAIVDDEIEHASLSHAVVVAAGSNARPEIAQESLALPRRHPDDLFAETVHHCVDVFCIGETVAVPLFKAMRDACTAEAALGALDRILVDEVRHRDFGWALLGWLIEVHGQRVRTQVAAELPAVFARVRRSYGEAGAGLAEEAAAIDAPTDGERAWGLMAAPRYAEILARCAERDYIPRFAKLGVDAAPAWNASQHARARLTAPPAGSE